MFGIRAKTGHSGYLGEPSESEMITIGVSKTLITGGLMIVVMLSAKHRDGIDLEEYQKLSSRMRELIKTIPGFISHDKVTTDKGERFSIIKFESEESLATWETNPEHLAAKKRGREEFYSSAFVYVYKTLREDDYKYV
jgi:heme-degrading monooxygenase HmoA